MGEVFRSGIGAKRLQIICRTFDDGVLEFSPGISYFHKFFQPIRMSFACFFVSWEKYSGQEYVVKDSRSFAVDLMIKCHSLLGFPATWQGSPVSTTSICTIDGLVGFKSVLYWRLDFNAAAMVI